MVVNNAIVKVEERYRKSDNRPYMCIAVYVGNDCIGTIVNPYDVSKVLYIANK